jgi:hypothetical protein
MKKQEENSMQNTIDELTQELKAKGAKEIEVFDLGESYLSINTRLGAGKSFIFDCLIPQGYTVAHKNMNGYVLGKAGEGKSFLKDFNPFALLISRNGIVSDIGKELFKSSNYKINIGDILNNPVGEVKC